MVVGALAVAAAVLLVVAGVAKLRTPAPAAAMIVGVLRVRRPARARALARGFGTVELAVGAATVVVGGRVALGLLAACYLVLSAVALRLATASRPVRCGCFGAADGDVGVAHVLLDLACLAVAIWACVASAGSVAQLFEHGALTGVVACAQALLLAALAYLSITALPALSSARRTVEGAS